MKVRTEKVSSQFLSLFLTVVVMLCLVATVGIDKVYADDMYQDKLVVKGASEKVTWNVSYDNATFSDYVLGTSMDRITDFQGNYGNSLKWSILLSDFEKCGALTKVSLTDTDSGEELYSIEAADKTIGIIVSDLYNGDERYSIVTPQLTETGAPDISMANVYRMSNIVWKDAEKTARSTGPKRPSYIKRGNTYSEIWMASDNLVTDKNLTITLFFNGSENAPAIPEEVQAVIDAIDAIDDPVTLDSEEKITAARAAFEALSEEDQALIDAETLKKLTDAEETLASLKAISNVVSMIDAIDNPVTLDSEEKINAAQTAYDNLKDEQKAQVTNYGDLLKAQLAIANLKLAKAEKDLEDAKKEADGKVAEAEGKVKDAEAKLAEAEKKLKAAKKIGKVQIKTVKGAKKKITVTWKKKTGVKGYEIIVAKNKAGTKDALTYSVKGNKAKKVIKKLKKGKYFVKVRAYKTFNGNTLYGTWSTAKKVKVK